MCKQQFSFILPIKKEKRTFTKVFPLFLNTPSSGNYYKAKINVKLIVLITGIVEKRIMNAFKNIYR